MDTRKLSDRLQTALETLPAEVRQVLSLRYGIGDRHGLSLKTISNRTGIAPAQVAALEVSGIRKLRKPALSRPLFEALGSLSRAIWDSIAQKVSEAGSLVYKDSSMDKALNRLPGEVQIAVRCKCGDLSVWLTEYASATPTAWFRTASSAAAVTEATSKVEEIYAQDRLPMPLATILRILKCNSSFLQFVLALCRLDLAVYDGRYVARRPLTSDSMRAIRVHRLLAKDAPEAASLPEIVAAYNQAYRDDHISASIAEAGMRSKEQLFQRSDEAWVPVDADAGDSDGSHDSARFHFERLWEETSAVDLIKEALELVDSARYGEIVKIVMKRSNHRYLAPSIVGALVSSREIIQVTPARFSLRKKCAGMDPTLATSSLLLNRRDCRRFIVDRYAGEPLQSYPLWTAAMERKWCCWAERDSERNTGIGFGGKSDRSFNRSLYQSVLSVADPTRWPVDEVERKAWAFKKACHGAYRFADNIADAVWENVPTLQDLFSAADSARRCGYLNWIRVNRALALEEHSPKAVPTLALLAALGFIAAAEHWQAKHALGPRLDEGLTAMIKEIRKKGFLHWRDEAGIALRKQLVAAKDASLQPGGWVEFRDVRRLLAALEGRRESPEEETKESSPKAAEPGSKPLQSERRPRQAELPF